MFPKSGTNEKLTLDGPPHRPNLLSLPIRSRLSRHAYMYTSRSSRHHHRHTLSSPSSAVQQVLNGTLDATRRSAAERPRCGQSRRSPYRSAGGAARRSAPQAACCPGARRGRRRRQPPSMAIICCIASGFMPPPRKGLLAKGSRRAHRPGRRREEGRGRQRGWREGGFARRHRCLGCRLLRHRVSRWVRLGRQELRPGKPWPPKRELSPPIWAISWFMSPLAAQGEAKGIRCTGGGVRGRIGVGGGIGVVVGCARGGEGAGALAAHHVALHAHDVPEHIGIGHHLAHEGGLDDIAGVWHVTQLGVALDHVVDELGVIEGSVHGLHHGGVGQHLGHLVVGGGSAHLGGD